MYSSHLVTPSELFPSATEVVASPKFNHVDEFNNPCSMEVLQIGKNINKLPDSRRIIEISDSVMEGVAFLHHFPP
ncbi:hypothetical protein Hdeb2414_s0028g00697921 [Helianthus debilis subsp. tardiflorus]